MSAWSRGLFVAVIVFSGCTRPHVEWAGERYDTCSTDDDCDGEETCGCTGVGADPCGPDLDPSACAEARCGQHLCFDPHHPPPPPP